ncbi:MAG: hypothetical protein KF836_00835 [Fimbriimonadaceae bacterium]|nr:hypothetical protein [Fimbriimonadaceae bacterium]
MTEAETFVWYRPSTRISLGIAHLAKQNAFRWLASVNISPESENLPAINASAGVQGIGTGNPGYSLTAEKNWNLSTGKFNSFLGVGFRSNENHAHAVAGAKYTLESGISIGFQMDGHQTHPFITYSKDNWTTGFFLVDGKQPAYMFGLKF